MVIETRENKRGKNIEYEINSNGCWICTSHAYNTYGYPQLTIDL